MTAWKSEGSGKLTGCRDGSQVLENLQPKPWHESVVACSRKGLKNC